MPQTEHTGAPLDYLLYLPPHDTADATQMFPLILFLHGRGERGSFDLLRTQALPRMLHEGHEMPFIVVSPLCPGESDWALHLDDVQTVLDTVMEAHRADPARVYLTGLSMGGFGTWELAMRSPQRFCRACASVWVG